MASERPVEVERERKSVGKETTFECDRVDREKLFPAHALALLLRFTEGHECALETQQPHLSCIIAESLTKPGHEPCFRAKAAHTFQIIYQQWLKAIEQSTREKDLECARAEEEYEYVEAWEVEDEEEDGSETDSPLAEGQRPA
ncbi:hypothetical protein KSC_029160 [Ktedonobacter sp. SOSP1-52]|nr:hypothetical protein KSC_029160 [Ktedonobacter sp. SOSP1-52]